MARMGRVQKGQDGSYRMTVDKRYETLPVLRRTVKTLSPFWFLLLAFKVSFIGAPERIAPQAGDPISFTTFGAAALISVFTWMLAAIGGKSERFPAVMAFNVFTVVTIFLHAARLFNLVINTKATNTELEATALSEVLEANIAYLANHREVVQKVVETLHVAVDGGLLLIGIPMASALHMYISEKKSTLKSVRKRPKAA